MLFYVIFLQGKFVAAFAQSNEGDVSPNTKGPHCQDTGKECDILHSTCDGKVGVLSVTLWLPMNHLILLHLPSFP